MSVRVQVILDEAERDELKRLAREEGLSLSGWLREAGRARAKERRARSRFESAPDLEEFFRACDASEPGGEEPEWGEHLRVIEHSRAQGLDGPK